MENVSFDPEVMYQQIKNYALIDVLKSFAPDEKTGDIIGVMLKAFVKNGVSVEVGMKIIQDMSEDFNK